MTAPVLFKLVQPHGAGDGTAPDARSAAHSDAQPGAHSAASLALRQVAYFCSATLIVLGLAVLVGWLLKLEPLMTVVPGKIRMKPNAAIGFIAAGVGLLCALRRSSITIGSIRRWTSAGMILFGAIPFALGAATLVEYLFHARFPFDELLFTDPRQWPFPGRMAPISAINFVLAGIAIALLAGGRVARVLSQSIALIIQAMAFAGFVGYLYGVPLFYGSIGYTSMALHTGVGFLVLALGILAAQPESYLARLVCGAQPGSWLMRRLVPVIAAGPVVLGLVYLRPAVSFGRPSFALALFAVTLVISGLAAMVFAASALNRIDTERREIAQVRERAAAAISQSERELLLVTDHLPVLLSYLDANGRFVRVNRTYEEWLGLPADRIVGRTVQALLGEEYWARVRPIRDLALEGQPASFETAYPTVRGERLAQVTYAPDRDEHGAVRGMACMVVDVDDHRKAESALRQSEKLAVVGRLASSIAHEINNPLEAVTNLLYLLEQDTAGVHPAHGYVLQAQEELARVSQIVVQTLRFHRQATHPALCRASELVEQVLGLYRGRIAGANVAVAVRFRDNIPLRCREGEVRQVIANLVGNAIDAMNEGGRLLIRTRTIASHDGPAGVLFTVADTGHGIPPETLQRIFEPFYSTKGEKGSGLGLWVSKEIVDRHLGSLRIRSSRRPGTSGTIFAIFFPTIA